MKEKLIFTEPAEVISRDQNGAFVKLPGGKAGTRLHSGELAYTRKVLGLLGDEGLTAQVGMKVECLVYGKGIVNEVIDTMHEASISLEDDEYYPVHVKFEDGGYELYTTKGHLSEAASRTLYVTAMPEEPKGYAVVKGEYTYSPFVPDITLTHKEAQSDWGNRLLHWIPETELK